jgi:hypothetical protein
LATETAQREVLRLQWGLRFQPAGKKAS